MNFFKVEKFSLHFIYRKSDLLQMHMMLFFFLVKLLLREKLLKIRLCVHDVE